MKWLLLEISYKPFENLNSKMGDTESMKELIASFYSLCITVGSVGILCTLVWAAIKLMSKDSRKRAQAKDEVIHKMVITICLFGIPFIVGIIASIVSAFAL